MESAATALQFRFMNAVTDQKLLHLSGCQGKSIKYIVLI